VLANVTNPPRPEADDPQPAHKTETVRDRDEHEPEPEEHVDLLVEEINRKDALDGVPVDVAHLSDLKVAQGDGRKLSRGAPLEAQDDVPHDVEPVEVVVRAQERV